MADPTQKPDDLRGETPFDPGSQALSAALKSSFRIIQILMWVLVAIFACSGSFRVGPEERAIVMRLGKPLGTGEQALLGPGLKIYLPYPIDSHKKVSIAKVQQVTSTVGWYATTRAMELAGIEPPPGATLNPLADGYALTSDGNIVHVRANLTYRIADPIRYIFDFENASNAVQNSLDDALLGAAASYKVDDILTRDVIGFNELVRKRVTDLVAKRGLGVVIEQCSVQSIPPRQLKEAFANVLRSEVKRNQVMQEARSHENQVLSKASADADSIKNAAQSDRVRLVREISSRADQFRALLPQYQKNPGLFTQQRLTETLGRVFTNAQDKIFVSESASNEMRELRLLLNREPIKPKSEEPRQ